MGHTKKHRNRSKDDFKKLLAKCMAKALFTYDQRDQDNTLDIKAKNYQETVSRLENDILLEDDERFQSLS